MVSFLKNGKKTLNVLAMKDFEFFLRFPHKDFTETFRVIFPKKRGLTEDVRIHLWIENQNKASTTLKAEK